MKKSLVMLGMVLVVCIVFAGCVAGPKAELKYQASFPSVPLSERVGGEWTGGPVN